MVVSVEGLRLRVRSSMSALGSDESVELRPNGRARRKVMLAMSAMDCLARSDFSSWREVVDERRRRLMKGRDSFRRHWAHSEPLCR